MTKTWAEYGSSRLEKSSQARYNSSIVTPEPCAGWWEARSAVRLNPITLTLVMRCTAPEESTLHAPALDLVASLR